MCSTRPALVEEDEVSIGPAGAQQGWGTVPAAMASVRDQAHANDLSLTLPSMSTYLPTA